MNEVKKKKSGGNKKVIGVIMVVFIILSTFVWHEYRVSKREAAQAAQSISYE
jgi:hypothetical protein